MGKLAKTVVLDVVGLTPGLIGENTPNLSAFAAAGGMATVDAAFPAVTTTAQTTYLTGRPPSEHGVVANGWYFRETCEVRLWQQSDRLVQRPRLWEAAREEDSSFTCANMFWWYNMYSSVDYSVTPRPMYLPDGLKLPDIYTRPAGLREELQSRLGQFPLFEFWGPNSSIRSSRWIAEASKEVERRYSPTLSLVYLPHLDYNLQRVGPGAPELAEDLRQIDRICGELIDFYEARGARVILLSEYGITPVERPVHLNRLLRREGLVSVREELGRELLDAGESAAFAVADHQVAHVHVKDPAQVLRVRRLLEATEGVSQVLGALEKREWGIDHPRAGELVAVAEPDAFFTYYYWLEDRKAPPFARTVDIHRKPGFDPAELFLDPKIPFPKLKVAKTLLKKKLGFRYLMDVIPPDATLVRGSHGAPTAPDQGPLLMTRDANLLDDDRIPATQVHDLILSHLRARPPEVSAGALRTGSSGAL